jgi:NAD(P)-dependent dehydrogenase (short-subunit alcohol dehydrogenase family)
MNQILNNFALNNKRILITGASSGIGRTIAVHCAALGAECIIVGRNEERLSDTFTQLSDEKHTKIIADLTHQEAIADICSSVESLDGIVHCAGKVVPYLTKFLNDEIFSDVFDINFNASFNIMSGLLRARKVKPYCSIVFISSFASHYPYPTGSMYAASKAALEAYSKTLAIENTALKLRTNCLCPALVKTEMFERTFNSGFHDNADEKLKQYESYFTFGIGETSDVANATTFLLSNASRWITGQSIILDGGYLLGLLSKVF